MSFRKTRQGDTASQAMDPKVQSHLDTTFPAETDYTTSDTLNYTSLMNHSTNLITESDICERDSGNNQNVRQFESAQMASANELMDAQNTLSPVNFVENQAMSSIEPPTLFTTSVCKAPSTAFDKLAFKAIASTFEDLQKKGILVISNETANENGPFHLSANVVQFFMTEEQTENYLHCDPESWPKIPHSEALCQNYHTQLGLPNQSLSENADPASALLVGTTGKKVSLFDVAHFFGNIPFRQGVHSDDFPPTGATPSLTREIRSKDTHKNNKIITMLKFIVKYTNHDFTGPWIQQFFNRPLPEEVKELRTLFDTMKLSQKLEQHWDSLQKQRYNEHFRWLHRLAPINAEIWARKQLFKLREPNKYLRKKAMWHSVYRTSSDAHNSHKNTVYIPFGDLSNTHSVPEENSSLVIKNQTTLSNNSSTEEPGTMLRETANPKVTFSEWVKNSGANLSVTISYAWNELNKEGAMQKQSPEPHQSALIGALRDLEFAIRTYGVDEHRIEHEEAVQYAGVVLRFTQALHDYLEVKDRTAEMDEILGDELTEHEQCYDDLLTVNSTENGCLCYKCRVAWSDGSEECPCKNCASTEFVSSSPERPEISMLEIPKGFVVFKGSESEFEKTKRQIHYLDQVVDEGFKSKTLGIANENAAALPEDVRARLLRSARLQYYEKQNLRNLSIGRKNSEINQTESIVTSLDGHQAAAHNFDPLNCTV